MSNYGIKISKSGQDITTTDERNLIIDSKYGGLIIVQSGTAIITTSQSIIYTIPINHNLGYAPMFYVRVKSSIWPGGSANYLNPVPYNDGGGSVGNMCDAYSTNNQLVLRVDATNTLAYATLTFYYFIFANSITPIYMYPTTLIPYNENSYSDMVLTNQYYITSRHNNLAFNDQAFNS